MKSNKRGGRMKQLVTDSKTRLKKFLPIDTTLFLFQFFKHPNDIGALAPSSKALAESMTRFVGREASKPCNYLEAGAGTGAFTKAIVEKLREEDRLDVIEINPKFCARLEEKYADYPNIHIHNTSILDWKPGYQYDAIVSSLPFNAFPSDFVKQIYHQYQKVAKSGCMVTYCEYMALPGIRKLFISPKSRRALQATLDTTNHFEGEHEVQVDKVFANFPPALVHHCKL